jgi:hypothetical protein
MNATRTHCPDCGLHIKDDGHMPDCPRVNPTREELHADDVQRGAVHVNTERWQGQYCVIVPDLEVVGRWTTIAAFKSLKQAEAYAAGYCARRDEQTLPLSFGPGSLHSS